MTPSKKKNSVLLLLAIISVTVAILWWQKLLSSGALAIFLVLLSIAVFSINIWFENTKKTTKR